ncbi:MAG: hypothetical protein ABSG22_09600 [Sedimentisphaerales bacterium]
MTHTNGGPWHRWIDTSLDSPNDISEWQASPEITGHTYSAQPRSVVVLFAKIGSSRFPS